MWTALASYAAETAQSLFLLPDLQSDPNYAP
ncbi:hypothetical protein Pla111_02940 [Botrimarina hoheduenensis]|uniref:Uncharacterized protein n=1 Tax=Botrimarina hoheduenensis TaxID=2528000 RepID=A0A5C5WEE4_9BACT|nr:hypothetical protein Pla111_02940 [Botrimarina hoheduenensis]